jgi:hypothetical protein
VTIATTKGPTTVERSSSDPDHYFGANPAISIVKRTVTTVCVPNTDSGHDSHNDYDKGDKSGSYGGGRDDHGSAWGDKNHDSKSSYGKSYDDKSYGDKSYGDDKSYVDKSHDGKGYDDKSDDDKGHYNKGCVTTLAEDTDHSHDWGKGHGDDKGHDEKDYSYSDNKNGSKDERWASGGDDDKDYGDHQGGYDHGGQSGTLKRVETDNNVAPGPYVKVGSAIGWTYTVTNVGNVPLTNIVVTDDKEGVICTIPSLGSGQTAPACEKDGIAKAGQYENLGTAATSFGPVYVDGALVLTVPVIASDPDHYFGAQPAISIVKMTNGTDNNAAPGPVIHKGDHVTWTYIVSNVGNLPLTNVTVVDDQIGTITCPGNTLAVFPDPASTMTCSASGWAVAGQYMNTGTVTASSPFGTATDSDVEYYWGLDKKTYQGPSCR